jgi:hypothetical protein
MNWHERFGLDGRLFCPEGNPYFRLSEEARYRLAIRMLLWVAAAAFCVWVLGLVRWLTR